LRRRRKKKISAPIRARAATMPMPRPAAPPAERDFLLELSPEEESVPGGEVGVMVTTRTWPVTVSTLVMGVGVQEEVVSSLALSGGEVVVGFWGGVSCVFEVGVGWGLAGGIGEGGLERLARDRGSSGKDERARTPKYEKRTRGLEMQYRVSR
jgi:hypothetical protein